MGLLVVSTAWTGTAGAAESPKPLLRAVYFVPRDREPIADRADRLGRVLEEVQRFYRDGMKANGLGELSFDVERDQAGKLVLHEVRGAGVMRDYGRNDATKVRNEVKAALAERGINVDQEVVIIFQLLLEWNGAKAEEVGPFVGGGDGFTGTAWVYDDQRLDPKLLPSKEPGGYYQRPVSVGQFNTHYLGGVAHELGHALGLPHDCEPAADRPKGNSLMGNGNHTYGRELRKDGAGAFLSPASALPLARHPLFTGLSRDKWARGTGRVTAKVTRSKATFDQGKITLSGRLATNAPVRAIVALNDRTDIPGDYDATGWTCPVEKDGAFQLAVGDLVASKRYDLRLRVLAEDGRSTTLRFAYAVDATGKPDLSTLAADELLSSAIEAHTAKDKRAIAAVVARAKADLPAESSQRRQVEHLASLLNKRPERLQADAVPAGEKSINVSRLAFETEKVGWGSPLRDQAIVERGDENASPLLMCGGVFFDSGLFAHAPATHAVRLRGKWNQLRAGYGLLDGHDGSVVFAVLGDGKSLFRSDSIRDHQPREITVDISGVDRLEFQVTDAGDDTRSDWGAWLGPQLQR